ncbi:MAG: hypothetical protein Q7T76_06810 [Ferruginibacter sp.]|nr:hypothetical protein [Ferruginibacter sp.]
MNINRNNYESFFLLYIDNELSAEQKIAVDQFVQINPDLEEELVMLQQTVLKADELEFDFKESLFRSATSANEIEQQLLLHLDNELSSPEHQQITRLIQNDPSVKKQWELLQATRLDKNEHIPFPDNKILYRHEAGRVVAFPWLRVAAAAMLIGVATWAGVGYLNNDRQATNVEPVATVDIPAPAVQPKTPAVKDQQALPQPTTPEPASTLAQAAQKPVQEIKEVAPTNKRTPKIVGEITQEEVALKTTGRTNNLSDVSSENINRSSSNNTITASVTPKISDNNIRTGKNENVTDEYPKADATNTFATTASFNEAENRNEDHVFFLPEDKVKKTKLGGFFKKVKRVIERTANVKEGNNIKVANLEFAIQ